MSKLTTGTICMSLLLASSTVSADFLGFYVGVQKWGYDVEGDISSLGNNIDITQDLGLSDDDNITKQLSFEHPIPFLPNLMVRQIDLRGVSNGNASQDFTFRNIDVNTNDPTQLTYNLDHNEYTLYYEILDNWVNLDLGISAKQFDGEVAIAANLGTNDSSRGFVDISGSVPMLYGKAQFDLPLTGFSLGGQAHLGQFNDDKLSDIAAYVAYESGSGLGLEVGYRIFQLEFDNFDELSSDLTIDGFYVSGTFHF